ncbi:hypothetical protein [Lacimicrobium alkaliphilum]|nr:hypothetical protein [Lacimicrobium alkaliphilum]
MSLIMWVHVIFGTLAVLAGFMALVAPKGQAWHIRAGKLYVLTMLIMAAAGGLAALLLPQAINVFAAGLTAYLVMTAWHAANKKQLGRDPFEIISCVFILTIASICLGIGVEAMNSAEGAYHGYTYDAYFIIGGIAAFAALMDISLLIRGNVAGKQRIARHIWRMSVSYFIAVGSLFEGPGAQAFPDFLRESGVLGIPAPLVILFMLYWLIRTLMPRPGFKFSH